MRSLLKRTFWIFLGSQGRRLVWKLQPATLQLHTTKGVTTSGPDILERPRQQVQGQVVVSQASKWLAVLTACRPWIVVGARPWCLTLPNTYGKHGKFGRQLLHLFRCASVSGVKGDDGTGYQNCKQPGTHWALPFRICWEHKSRAAKVPMLHPLDLRILLPASRVYCDVKGINAPNMKVSLGNGSFWPYLLNSYFLVARVWLFFLVCRGSTKQYVVIERSNFSWTLVALLQDVVIRIYQGQYILKSLLFRLVSYAGYTYSNHLTRSFFAGMLRPQCVTRSQTPRSRSNHWWSFGTLSADRITMEFASSSQEVCLLLLLSYSAESCLT